MQIAVVGLGYVGLPLVCEAINSGHKVIGIDVNPLTVENLLRGLSHVDDISDDEISKILIKGFEPTTEFNKISECEVVVICVPTPLSEVGGPDLSYIESAGKQIAPFIKIGQLISLESTSYPGTTEEVLKPILEKGSKLSAFSDFYLVFSPERIDPGNQTFKFRNTPKVVGGLNQPSLEKGINFYSTIVDKVVPAAGLKEAEMSKLLENTYRHINIALVNEMAKFCHELKIDIWDVIKNASTKPFGFHAFYPGPGVGGHCIPIDPNYLSHKVQKELGYPFKFVELAEEINASMPSYVVNRLEEFIKGARGKNSETPGNILLIGISYKKDIADNRETPAEPILGRLVEKGFKVKYFDPLISNWISKFGNLESEKDLLDACENADFIILLQDHSCIDLSILLNFNQKIFDTKGVLPGNGIHKL